MLRYALILKSLFGNDKLVYFVYTHIKFIIILITCEKSRALGVYHRQFKILNLKTWLNKINFRTICFHKLIQFKLTNSDLGINFISIKINYHLK